METRQPCPLCGRDALTETWLKARVGLVPQEVTVFKAHHERVNATVVCPMSGHAALPRQKTPGQRS